MVTSIEHTDGRKLKLGSVVVQKFNGGDGIVRLSFARVTRIDRSQDGTFSLHAEVFKEGTHGRCGWDERHCGALSATDGGIQSSLWISNEADSGEAAIRFQSGNTWVIGAALGRWASPSAVAFSALHGGPTGFGRSDHGWAAI